MKNTHLSRKIERSKDDYADILSEAVSEIEELEEEVDRLEKENEELRNKIEELSNPS